MVERRVLWACCAFLTAWSLSALVLERAPAQDPKPPAEAAPPAAKPAAPGVEAAPPAAKPAAPGVEAAPPAAKPAAPAEDSKAAAPEAKPPTVRVADLRCEYLESPLGLDVLKPRLSWKLAAVDPQARGQRQSAYRILVASTEAGLAKDEGDLWDSGDVAGDRSTNVVYEGKPLSSGAACHWKVRVLDENGTPSAFSEPARWTMGPVEKADWKAKWIGTGDVFNRGKNSPPENTVPDPWLRKAFALPRAPLKATAYVASVGYHELHANGKKAGDAVLSPAVANHRKRARYVAYDLTGLLQGGKNAVGLWLGFSWSIYPHYRTPDKPPGPIVTAQIDIDLGGGETLRIATDESWRTHPSPSTLLGVWDFMNMGGELYDSRRDLPGWCAPDLDDSSWRAAVVFEPELVLSAERVEPNRALKEFRAVSVEEPSPGVYRADMGVNFAGFTEIQVRGKDGDRIDFLFSESPKQEMTHQLHSAYVVGPAGQGVFRNRFNYSVGRWVTVKGLGYKPAPEDFLGRLVRTDYRRATQFKCSRPLLNQIYETALWTFENLSLGGYVVDCPQRERMGYGGDAHATTPLGLANYSLGAFYSKWGEDWRDVQGPDGNLPYTAPTFWGGGGPAWSGFCVTLPWEVYRRYGDVRILEESFPTIERWLKFLETKASGDILRRWGGEWDFLGDWLWPGAEGVNGDTRETLFFNNCYWVYNLATAAAIADVLGRKDAAEAWRKRADVVRAAVHKEFFVPAEGSPPPEKGSPAEASYVNGFQAYLATALLVDLPPAELREAVWKRLEREILVERKGHIHAGITGGAFLFKGLMAAGRNDLILTMVSQEDFPGWGDMLKKGATTFWESWEGNLSLLHSSYLYVGAWFVEGLAGIQPSPQKPGFEEFVIRPGLCGSPPLEWAEATHESIRGPVRSAWKLEGGKVRLEVSVPPSTRATVFVPTTSADSVREGGAPAKEARGVEWVGAEGRQAVLRLVAGTYAFEADYAP